MGDPASRRTSRSPSSEDDEAGPNPAPARLRGRIFRMISDDSDSDGSPVRPSAAKKKRQALSQSESASDSEWQTENEDEKRGSGYGGAQSDSSDGNSDKCPICLVSFSGQKIGSPESCEHPFCADCITEWSKNVNTCPVDRIEFGAILVRRTIGGEVIKRVPVKPAAPGLGAGAADLEDLFVMEAMQCEICHSSEDEDTMLLCDLCDLGYHIRCLNPPLAEVPEDDWFCPDCAEVGDAARDMNVYENELDHLWEEIMEMGRPTGPRPSALRGERVRPRAGLRPRRGDAPSSSGGDAPSTSRSGGAVDSLASGSSGRRATARRKVGRPRRRRTRRVVVEYETGDGEKFPVKVKRVAKSRRKKKVKRRPRTAARRKIVKMSVRGRLAEHFGNVRSGGDTFSSALAPRFSLFGDQNELEYFADSDEDVPGFSGGAVAVAPRSIASAIFASHRQARRKMLAVSSPPHATSAVDVLSGIMESQSLFLSKKTSVSVARDGTLIYKPTETTRTPGEIAKKPDESAKRPDETAKRPDETVKKPDETAKRLSGTESSVDVRKTDGTENAKETPMYPGSSRGGGGGGNWRNNRDYRGSGGYNRGNRGYHSGDGYQNSSGNGGGGYRDSGYDNSDFGNRSFGNNNPWYDCDQDNRRHSFGNFNRNQPPFNRQNNRDRESQMRNQNLNNPQYVPWHDGPGLDLSRPYVNRPNPRNMSNPDPVDMSLGHHSNSYNMMHSTTVQFDGDQPPIIRFEKPPLSDDENVQPDAPVTVDEYDPMEPTVGDSDEEGANNLQPEIRIVSPPSAVVEPEVLEVDTNVSLSNENIVNDDNVQVKPFENSEDLNDDCPNFSIYSSTSVDLLVSKETDTREEVLDDHPQNDEDLVQEDDVPSPETETQEVRENEVNVEIIKPKTTPVKLLAAMSSYKADKKVNYYGQKVETSEKPKHPIKINLIKPIAPENITSFDKLDDVENELARLQNDDEPSGSKRNPEDSDNLEKFTESISDAEDERSYTPCLDENRSKDTTIESEKETSGIGGMDTEMISEDEGNEIFSDNRGDNADKKGVEDTEIKKQKIKAKVKELLEQPEIVLSDEDKKKKRRDKKSDKENNEKSKGRSNKDESDLSFKKLSKTGKERNYRDREEKHKNKENRRSKSADSQKRERHREKKAEKRKDIERYDVRNIISEKKKSRRYKDAFGRDTSRPRSKSQESQASSPGRVRRSASKRRSLSADRISLSIVRSLSRNRSLSPRRRVSVGRTSPPRGRRSLSRGRKRSVSRSKRNRSISKGRKSTSPRGRRVLSPVRRRSNSPKIRKIVSPRKRSPSPKVRSPIRIRRSVSPRNRRSRSRNRSLSKQRNRRVRSRSRSRRLSPRLHRAKSPKHRVPRRSRSKVRSVSRNRSKSRGRKARKPKRNRSNSSRKRVSRSPVKNMRRRNLRSPSAELILSSSPPRRNITRGQWEPPAKSPPYQAWSSNSRSMSPVARRSPGWTADKVMEPQNLRVILTTKEKLKKRDKKKKTSKKNKGLDRINKTNTKDMVPSKEVFTSGNNILVSVSFNKNQDTSAAPISSSHEVVPKRKKRKAEVAVKAKKDKKEKIKKKRAEKVKRRKDIENKKPVAIIDLDRSPFKELTPSPKAVIVLSDSDGEKEPELVQRQELLRNELRNIEFPPTTRAESPVRTPPLRETYTPPTGPKTPPEPAVKFTIMNKSNLPLRSVNPLHEEDDEQPDEETQEKEQANQEAKPIEPPHKGPNTPPESPNSPPSSPDAYNPFEPTKSGSATPERATPSPLPVIPSIQIENEKTDMFADDTPPPIQSMTLEAAQKSNLSADDVIQARPISPMEKVMALLKSTSNNLSPNAMQAPYPDQTFDNMMASETENTNVSLNQSPERIPGLNLMLKPSQPQSFAAIKPNSPKLIYSTVAPTIVTATSIFPNPTLPRVSVYGTGSSPSIQRAIQPTAPRILLPSPTKSSPLKSQQNKLFLSKPSPIKSTPIKPMPSKTLISKLPLPSVKPMPNRNPQKPMKLKGQNGNEVINMDLDMDSPYSPGSSDFGDLFDPPPDPLPLPKPTTTQVYPQKSSKQDMFDVLFGSKPIKKTPTPKVPIKPVQKPKVGKGLSSSKIDEETLRIIDEMPSSAFDLQLKTKYLKKLHRQERIVEEVKLVLKPHYYKKRISKEVYKEIMRRAVPKICHSRSQEINPAKIHAFIEAYVKKFRKKVLHVRGA